MVARPKYLKTIIAVMFALITVLMPTAKNLHVSFHATSEIIGEVITEDCPLCNIEFPAFEFNDNNIELNTVERPFVIYVPNILGNLCNNKVESLVIRGPPSAICLNI